METDVIANDLNIRLFLFGLTALCVFEGARARAPFNYGIWFLAGVFLLAGAFLTPLFSIWPAAVATLGNLVINPVSWFVCLVGLFFVLRPYWKKESQQIATQQPAATAELATSLPIIVPQLSDDQIAEIASLSSAQQNTLAQFASVSERLSVLEASNAVTSSIATKLYKAKQAELILEKVVEFRLLLEDGFNAELPNFEHGGGQMPALIENAKGYSRLLSTIPGFQDSEFESEVVKREDAIRSNAMYCTLNEHDAKFFRDGPEKQAYCMSRERITCYIERLNALEIEAKNDIEFAKRE